MMVVYVNGAEHSLPADTTVAMLIEDIAGGRSGIAVARNGVVVSRSRWAIEAVDDGDHIEILAPVQGG